MGSRRTGNDMDKVYGVASWWVRHVLQNNGSLFTPGKAIWSSELLAEVRGVLDSPSTSRKTFWENLHEQLTESPPDVYQLMAEAVYVHYIGRTDVEFSEKIDNINQLLMWSEQPGISDSLREPLLYDVLGFYFGRTPIRFSVCFLIEFAEQWKEQTHSDCYEMLKAPWAFKSFATGLEFRSELLKYKTSENSIQQREALLHLVHPDTFEAIVNVSVKEGVAASFEYAIQEETNDVDRKLQQIHANLHFFRCHQRSKRRR